MTSSTPNPAIETTPSSGLHNSWLPQYDASDYTSPPGPNADRSPRHSGNNSLCDACDEIFSGPRKVARDYGVPPGRYGHNLTGLEASAKNGCRLCRLLWSQLVDKEKERLQACSEIRYGFQDLFESSELEVNYYYDTSRRSKPRIQKKLLMLNADRAEPRLKDRSTRFATTNNSIESFATARKWLDHCSSKHFLCQNLIRDRQSRYEGVTPSEGSKELPTRLIDLGDGEQIEPKLCTGISLPPKTRYITLSHCWGSVKFRTLTSDSLHAMEQGISVSDLTLTFKHAMEVTKRIGCRYLWIDSFCIIQDDPEDWADEAARMSDVYQNSWCNLAAAKASDGSYGLFSKRDPLTLEPCSVQGNWNDYGGVRGDNRYYLFDRDAWEKDVVHTPLQGRGWVTQELILASRVIYFGPTQLAWDCPTIQALESFPGGLVDRSLAPVSLNPRVVNEARKSGTAHPEQYALWSSIIRKYTGTKLSFPEKDKLLAIDGIAQAIEISGTYLAGLWSDALPSQILWSTTSPVGENGIARSYQAPSWSWASLNGQIAPPQILMRHNMLDSKEVVVNILEAATRLKTVKDRFGPVADGYLILEGLLLRSRVQMTQLAYGSVAGIRCNLKFDTVIPDPIAELIFLAVLIQSRTVYGLILRPLADAPATFHRCGYFQSADPAVKYLEESLTKKAHERGKGWYRGDLSQAFDWNDFKKFTIKVV